MKRILLTVICLLALTTTASAHNLSTAAAFSLSGNELTVRVMDVYGAAVEGAKSSAATAPPDGRQGKAVALSEVAPGTYRGTLTPPGTDRYDIYVEFTVLNELFRGSLRVKAGEDLAETMVAMVPVDPPLKHSVWGPVLYGAAAVVLVVATVIAIRRQRSGEDEEE
ncbi:MAG TPA: hypothetical protein VNT75_06255 [Symbiobacteriaceae bacterium]|nr:hypothetical protein [Symbiobacteriaceae bacterium]